MKRTKTVDQYILVHPEWKEELIFLRDILKATELEEEVKWGAPCYALNGKNVVGIGAFKSYIGLWFHQGALLQDKEKVLMNAQEGVTKAQRQWRFSSIDEMDRKLIEKYVREAIDNQKKGREIKPEKNKKLILPEELKELLSSDSGLKSNFESFPPYKQREFAEHVENAKREETRKNRLKKIIPMIRNKVGLSDKYRK